MSVEKRARDTFATRWGFTLACIGSAVGMGNIWMFPQRVSKYGGGTFLIPYFLFMILIAASGVVGEMALGRGTRSGSMGAFRCAVESRGGRGALGELLGAVPVLGSLALAIGYSVVVGWILKYTDGMDAVSIYVCLLGAAMAGIMFFWGFGGAYVAGKLQKGRKAPLPRWGIPLGTYVYCVLTVVVLILGVVIPGGIG
ncbi:MAG: hypothetical protein CSA35_00355 [Dethiosulfovibrio peptidovorans]|nr:MAG: hypothetical protein CSA35_00355 [Dethiosulfovibrio peptidovorans]